MSPASSTSLPTVLDVQKFIGIFGIFLHIYVCFLGGLYPQNDKFDRKVGAGRSIRRRNCVRLPSGPDNGGAWGAF